MAIFTISLYDLLQSFSWAMNGI